MIDRVQVSFGGCHYDVLREKLIEDPSIGWNLLSCLFMKRWEKFLLEDKSGRIFLDYETEWISPLLDAIRGHSIPVTDASIKAVIEKLCSDFHINKSHVFGDLPMVIDDLEYSMAQGSDTLLRMEIFQAIGTDGYYGVRLFSSESHSISSWRTRRAVPHTITCILLQMTNGDMYSALIEKDYDFTFCKDDIFVARLMRPLKKIKELNHAHPLTAKMRIGSHSKVIELNTDLNSVEKWHGKIMKIYRFEVFAIHETRPSSFKEAESNSSLKSAEALLFESSVELVFMQSFIYNLWKDLIPSFPSPTLVETPVALDDENAIQSYLAYFETVLPMITQFKETLISASCEERRRLDPLAYFNVEGRLFVTRKSTILEAFPDSQLAVRVSGRWTEQEQDIDEDGNIYYDVRPEAFKSIIRYAREKKLLGRAASVKMMVKKEMEGEVRELLQYLSIDASGIEIISH